MRTESLIKASTIAGIAMTLAGCAVTDPYRAPNPVLGSKIQPIDPTTIIGGKVNGGAMQCQADQMWGEFTRADGLRVVWMTGGSNVRDIAMQNFAGDIAAPPIVVAQYQSDRAAAYTFTANTPKGALATGEAAQAFVNEARQMTGLCKQVFNAEEKAGFGENVTLHGGDHDSFWAKPGNQAKRPAGLERLEKILAL